MFQDRHEAGEELARRLQAMAPADPVVLALPRGGVPVALPVARALGAPLDLLLVRKLGLPGHEELAAGAVVEGAGAVFNRDVLRMAGLSERDFEAAIAARRAEIADRRARYLGGRPPVPVAGRTAVVVDDGIATGATVRAALRALAGRGPARVVLAVPVAPQGAVAEMRALVDDFVCLEMPSRFHAVGAHYRRFDQLGDSQVVAMLEAYEREREEER